MSESYHCVCSTLLLVLPAHLPLSSLPHRRAEGLQNIAILPILPESQPRPLLLHTTVDRKPIIVQRPDGFEKRWLRKCAHCRVPWGYQLQVDEETDGQTEEESNKSLVLYLFPDSLINTDDLEKKTKNQDQS
jgi:hypothetical protein